MTRLNAVSASGGRFAAAVGILVLLAAPAAAITPSITLIPPDLAANYNFGAAVAISGTTAVVGSPLKNDFGDATGAAYLFDATNGGPITRLQPFDFLFPEGMFGASVAISTTRVVVGAPAYNVPATGGGAAFLFDSLNGFPFPALMPVDPRPNQQFGKSVGVSGQRIIVGAPGDDDMGTAAGAVYTFNSNFGEPLLKLFALDADADDLFGSAVSNTGTRAIVGAPGKSDAGTSSGAAYLFDVQFGPQLFKLTASDADALDRFGESVAVSAVRAIVGAPGDDDAGSDSGSAYVFDALSGLQLWKLTASDAAPGDMFGSSVSISGGLAVVGAKNDDGMGSAYVFNAMTGQQLFKLTAFAGNAGDSLGASVGINFNRVVVGVPLHNGPGSDAGVAYMFQVPEPASAALLVCGCIASMLPYRRTRSA